VPRGDGTHKSILDVRMALDVIDLVRERPEIDTVVLATGDCDFLRVAERLRLRHGKKVVVIGVPGATSRLLEEAATHVDILPVDTSPARAPLPTTPTTEAAPPLGTTVGEGYDPAVRRVDGGIPPTIGEGTPDIDPDDRGLVRLMLWLDEHWVSRCFGDVVSYIASSKRPAGRAMTRGDAARKVNALIAAGVLRRDLCPGGGTDLRVNRDHAWVKQVLRNWQARPAKTGVSPPRHAEGPRVFPLAS